MTKLTLQQKYLANKMHKANKPKANKPKKNPKTFPDVKSNVKKQPPVFTKEEKHQFKWGKYT